jgi:hypothetical protein
VWLVVICDYGLCSCSSTSTDVNPDMWQPSSKAAALPLAHQAPLRADTGDGWLYPRIQVIILCVSQPPEWQSSGGVSEVIRLMMSFFPMLQRGLMEYSSDNRIFAGYTDTWKLSAMEEKQLWNSQVRKSTIVYIKLRMKLYLPVLKIKTLFQVKALSNWMIVLLKTRMCLQANCNPFRRNELTTIDFRSPFLISFNSVNRMI